MSEHILILNNDTHRHYQASMTLYLKFDTRNFIVIVLEKNRAGLCILQTYLF